MGRAEAFAAGGGRRGPKLEDRSSYRKKKDLLGKFIKYDFSSETRSGPPGHLDNSAASETSM